MGSLNVSDLVGLAGAPLVLALVQLVRATWPELPTHYVPALTLAIAIGLNLALSTVTGASLQSVVLVGMLTGLTASGLYSHARAGQNAASTKALPSRASAEPSLEVATGAQERREPR